MSRSVRPAISIPRVAGILDAVHDAQRLADRVAVRPVGTQQQRAVDVEQQQHRPPTRGQRANDVSALSDCANAAISRAQASMSPSCTISTGECM